MDYNKFVESYIKECRVKKQFFDAEQSKMFAPDQSAWFNRDKAVKLQEMGLVSIIEAWQPESKEEVREEDDSPKVWIK